MLIAINYHYIRTDFSSAYPSIFGQTPDEFALHLDLLARIGSFVSSDNVCDMSRSGAVPDGFHFLVTFDDGLLEQFELALPILEKKGIPAVFFVNTAPVTENRVELVHKIHVLRSENDPVLLWERLKGFCAKKNIPVFVDESVATAAYKYDGHENAKLKYLLNYRLDSLQQREVVNYLFTELGGKSEEEIANQLYMGESEIAALSHCSMLGSHGHNHVSFGGISVEERKKDIAQSVQIFERICGKIPGGFSYPFGTREACPVEMADELSAAGYEFALTMERAINHSIRNPFFISRFSVSDLPMKSCDPDKIRSFLAGFENPAPWNESFWRLTA